jgi:hypothetical protein
VEVKFISRNMRCLRDCAQTFVPRNVGGFFKFVRHRCRLPSKKNAGQCPGSDVVCAVVLDHGMWLANTVGAKATALCYDSVQVFALNPVRIPNMEESHSEQTRHMAVKCPGEREKLRGHLR